MSDKSATEFSGKEWFLNPTLGYIEFSPFLPQFNGSPTSPSRPEFRNFSFY